MLACIFDECREGRIPRSLLRGIRLRRSRAPAVEVPEMQGGTYPEPCLFPQGETQGQQELTRRTAAGQQNKVTISNRASGESG